SGPSMKRINGFFCAGFIIILFFSPEAHTQSMKTVDILAKLNLYQDLLKEMQQQELVYLQARNKDIRLSKVLSVEYSFITLELMSSTKEEDSGQLYCSVRFELTDQGTILNEVFCEEESRKLELEKRIKKNKALYRFILNDKSNESFPYSPTIFRYLNIADTIAVKAMHCARGDDYRPGFYSKIEITDEFIVLSQINHMNSRSLEHKENYSLRDLEFIIPLTGIAKDPSRYDYQIGEMLVEFSDRSSSSYKSCGAHIKEQMEQEKKAYDGDGRK
ncbi:MAG: hypothetical protein ACJ75J_06520, partial [Cytophagaceae bacterium]